jgi:tetratricopeptide (TPR) repeat protein
MVRDDTRIRAASAENLARIATTDYWWPQQADRLYRPLTTASYLFNYAILGNGDSPAGYHSINFLLHTANVWLVFALAMRLFQRAGPAFFAAAIWAVHPAGTETVANVAGRADLLGAMAVLGGLRLYIRTTAWTWRPIVALFAISMAGLLSKENAAVLIGLMLLYDLVFGESGVAAAVRTRWPAYGVVAASLAIFLLLRQRIFAGRPWTPPPVSDNPLLGTDFWSARLTAIRIAGKHLWTLVWPADLSFDHSYNQIPIAHAADWRVWLSLLAIVAILALVIVRFRRDPLLFWAAGFFGITLLPTSNLIFLIGAATALRFLYLPSVAAAIAIAALAYRLKSDRAAAIILTAAILLAGARTFARNPAWDSDLALASTDVFTVPNSYRVHHLLAESLYLKDPKNNLQPALREEEAAWAILQTLPPISLDLNVINSLGRYYRFAGENEKSLAVLLRGREMVQAVEQATDQAQQAGGKPLVPRVGHETLHFNLGRTYISLQRYPEAIAEYRAGRAINPVDRAVYDEMATFYATRGDLDNTAIILNEKAHVFGLSPNTLASLRNVYARIPDGACAILPDGTLNPQCPRLQRDLCTAWSDLAQAYRDARAPDRAEGVASVAATKGCPHP